MFVDSFDERSESFDGSPQPLAEESIVKTSTLNIALSYSCQGGSFDQGTVQQEGGSRRREAG
tara:strand:- start:123 stop:308 length:186 start_codon:yes stop_codon:yes gene_type:complete